MSDYRKHFEYLEEGITVPDDARFGLGAIGSNDEIIFKEFSRDTFENQSHGRCGNPFGRRRFRYIGGIVEWSDCVTPTEEQKHLVETYLERRGFPVTKHTSIYDDYNTEDDINESILSELRVNKLNTTDDHISFVAYKDNLFLLDDNSDLMKLYPYFKDHPQLKYVKWGNPFDESHIGDLHEFMSTMSELAPDVLTGRYEPKFKQLSLDWTQEISPTSSLILKKVVKQLGIKKVNASSYTEDGDTKDITYSKKKIIGDVPSIVFHGTSSEYLENILKYGIKPDEGVSNFQTQDVWNTEEVFFAADFHRSEFYAFNTKDKAGGIPVIFEFTIPDKDLLKPDFDADTASTQQQYYQHHQKHSTSKSDLKPMTLSREQGKWGYSGRIPASFIRWVYFYRTSDKKWIKFKPSTISKILDNYGIEGLYRYGIEL